MWNNDGMEPSTFPQVQSWSTSMEMADDEDEDDDDDDDDLLWHTSSK